MGPGAPTVELGTISGDRGTWHSCLFLASQRPLRGHGESASQQVQHESEVSTHGRAARPVYR
jgi:hypothetical protein